MHSNSLGPSEKIPFVENYKECTICAILREKTRFWGYPEAKKGVVLAQVRQKCSPEAQQKFKSLGAIRKNVYCVESLRFCR